MVQHELIAVYQNKTLCVSVTNLSGFLGNMLKITIDKIRTYPDFIGFLSNFVLF